MRSGLKLRSLGTRLVSLLPPSHHDEPNLLSTCYGHWGWELWPEGGVGLHKQGKEELQQPLLAWEALCPAPLGQMDREEGVGCQAPACSEERCGPLDPLEPRAQ